MRWNCETDELGIVSLRIFAKRRIESYDHGSSISLLRMIAPAILLTSDLVEIIRLPDSFLVRRLVFLCRNESSGVS